MGVALILAEKPSVARNIAQALKVKTKRDGFFENEQYIVTWAFGHLLQLYDAKDYDKDMKSWRIEKFPFIPANFKYKIKSDSKNKNSTDNGAKKQLEIIKSLSSKNEVDRIISAVDADREGEVLATEILTYLKIKKPIYRLLLNEWTEDEVCRGMDKLVPIKEMQPLQDAGLSRQLADWIIGINLTSITTLTYGERKRMLNIGRVLLPTLKIIYDRDMEIETFQESSYYKLLGNFKRKTLEEFEGIYYEEENEKFEDNIYLEGLRELLKDKQAKVIDKVVTRKKEYPPLLFNLSNLQGHVTSKYKGWTSDKVLKVAQSLYEKKFITYPRTGSVALEESLKDRAKKVLEVVKVGLPFEKNIKFTASKRVFDNSKVESHSAIIPTYMVPSGLTGDERIVYEAIKNRFIMQFMPIAEFDETVLKIKVQEERIPGEFIAKGRIQLIEGWRVVEKIETKDTVLPSVEKEELLEVVDSSVNKVVKKPPKSHTEKTLLRVMETCGKSFKAEENEEDSEEMMKAILSGFSIGTPATRAETIKKLKDVGYITTKGKSLKCTDLGKNLVETFPIKDLLDLEYTGRLEKTLSDIEKEKYSKEDFLNMIKEFTISSVGIIKESYMRNSDKATNITTKEEIGKCPECGSSVIENSKAFGCSNWKNGCKFAIWKDDKYISSFNKTVSKEMVALLLKNGKVGFRNLKSKKGNVFSAYFIYEKDTETGIYKWKMEFI